MEQLTDSTWQKEAEQLGGAALVKLVSAIYEVQKDLAARIETMECNRRDCSANCHNSLDSFRKAFPNGDIEGHRRYHEEMIKSNEAKLRLAEAIREKTLSALVWAAIVGFGALLWHGVQVELAKFIPTGNKP